MSTERYRYRIDKLSAMQLRDDDALSALRGTDLLELGMVADAVRREKHPENGVTYALSGLPGRSLEQATREAVEYGNAEVMLADLANIGSLSCDELVSQLHAKKSSFPAVTFYHLPLSVLFNNKDRDEDQIVDVLSRLQDAGLRSIELGKTTTTALPVQLRAVLRAARALDIGTSVAMNIGNGEALEQRVSMLAELRSLQAETCAIQSVLVRIYHATTPEARREEEATAVDYLKTLAVTRLMLDNIEHVQTEWAIMGPKVLELALRFGADDAGTIARTQAGPGPSHHAGEAELRRIIRDAGFRPVERDGAFRRSLLQ